MENDLTEAQLKRQKAIEQLIKSAKSWKASYTFFDYILDDSLRTMLGMPDKELGKPPYDWIELYND